jgi:hypothetical protein
LADTESNRKLELENQVKKASDAIYDQIDGYKKHGKTALVVGGIIVAAYAITQLFEEDEIETEKKKDSSAFGSALTGMATSVALHFAKEKLMAYLDKNS